VKISRTTIAVAGALPAGMLLEVVVQAAASASADTVHTIGGVAGFTALVSGAASVSWFGPKAVIDRHEETVRRSRHRRAAADATGTRRPRPVPDGTIEQPHQDVATPEEHQALADALWDERAQRPAYVDPYLIREAADVARASANVDADGYPAPDPETRVDLKADLYGDRTPGAVDDTAILGLEAHLRAWYPAAT
jgi:hypothetical protein